MSRAIFTTKSTTIHKVDYHENTKVLEIEFRSGNVYLYQQVPARLWQVFKLYTECDGSPGSFFNEYIKGKYTSEKIRDVHATAE